MTDLTPTDLRQQPGVCRHGRPHGDDCGACDLSPDASPCTGQQPAQPDSRAVERWCNDLFNTGRAVEHYEHPSMRPLSEEEYILYRAARARESAARDCIRSALAAAKAYADDMEARYHTAHERLAAAQQRIAELESENAGLRTQREGER